MRLFTAAAALLMALSLSAGVQAQTSPFDAARLSEHIRILSADDYEGRGIATPAEDKVIAYLSEQYAAAGLQPGGDNGGWTQAVALNRFTASNIQAQVRVGDWSQPLTQGEQIVISSRRPGEDHVMLMDAPLVFVGYGIHAPERDWDDFKGQDMTGKILVVLVNDADFEEPALDTFGGKAMTYYGRWTYKYEEAARQGAAGVIIVHETDPASYGWTTVRNSWSGANFDIVRADANERVPMESWIQRDVAVDLFQRAGLDFEALKRSARNRDFQPVTLTGAAMDVMFDVASTQIETHNVIARLPGRTRPDETFLYTGHWDHIGIGTPDANGDAIFNGAVDNASGTAGLLELARVFGAGPAPERSVVFISFTAEESGLLGSEYYAANPIYPLATTVGGINMDSANVYGRVNAMGVVGYGQSDFDDRLLPLVEAQGRVIQPDENPASGSYFRSDHFPLAKRGVPMAYADSAGDFVEEPIADRAAARDAYTAGRYHQADDEWSADWDYSGQIQDLDIYLALGRSLVDGAEWPQWKAGSEFAAVRARSASERE
ncbi:M28 family metallopeptidase [Brevundimonas subvibrioides]|uniref:Peptidase M28 n=1 Tax=Brevundimonas subvibrioides (strain ATCC 15264 / DSM 4735 / LMG 14903 / NBRC 16000 / CB 81) TaxID=633149 RepID=D9QM59_BRESC|nr:M28 family metallopeptidase [Brevundimonas subvibrioides]ADL01985.1 peptidase M28 [Brevundimonas subvibrioides ATCC 15264]